MGHRRSRGAIHGAAADDRIAIYRQRTRAGDIAPRLGERTEQKAGVDLQASTGLVEVGNREGADDVEGASVKVISSRAVELGAAGEGEVAVEARDSTSARGE